MKVIANGARLIRIVHIAGLSSAADNMGVVRQMQYEEVAAREMGIPWHVELWSGVGVSGYDLIKLFPARARSRLARRIFLLSRLRTLSRSYDVIIFRYPVSDPFLWILGFLSDKVYLLHHTKESPAVRAGFPGIIGKISALAENVFGTLSVSRACGLIGVTGEILSYERKRSFAVRQHKLLYPNGISYSEVSICPDRRGGAVKVYFVASTFFSWNGLDRVLQSFAKCPIENLELHLIGRVLDDDVKYIADNCLTFVHMHGVLSGQEIAFHLSSADVGLAAFSISEADLSEACTLKVREYLATGVPVYSGHRDVALPPEFTFYKIGPADIEDIYRFALSMRSYQRAEIRNASQRYIEKKTLVEKIYSSISEHIEEARR